MISILLLTLVGLGRLGGGCAFIYTYLFFGFVDGWKDGCANHSLKHEFLAFGIFRSDWGYWVEAT